MEEQNSLVPPVLVANGEQRTKLTDGPLEAGRALAGHCSGHSPTPNEQLGWGNNDPRFF